MCNEFTTEFIGLPAFEIASRLHRKGRHEQRLLHKNPTALTEEEQKEVSL